MEIQPLSTKDAKADDSIDVPAGAAAIGVDGEGAIHWLGSRVTNDGLPVFVEEPDGEIDVFDLAETPCWDADDPVRAWIHHVQDKRNDWDSITRCQSHDAAGDEYGGALMMATTPSTEVETPATTARSVRAATRQLATYEQAPGLYLVDNGKQGNDHAQYVVEPDAPACTCADWEYRSEGLGADGCLHIRRACMERREIDITPLLATDLDLDPLLLERIDTEDQR